MYAASAAAAIATAHQARAQEPIGTKAVEKIAEDAERARRHRGVGKRKAKAAIRELVASAQSEIVAHHLKPRWLRQEVLTALALKLTVTEADITELRTLGYERRGEKLWKGADRG
jgi:hypothetical protein